MDLDGLKKIGEEIVEEHRDELRTLMLENLKSAIRGGLKDCWSSPVMRTFGSIIDLAIDDKVKQQIADAVELQFQQMKPELLKISNELMKAQIITLHEAILREWMEVMGTTWKRSEFLKRLFGRNEE